MTTPPNTAPHGNTQAGNAHDGGFSLAEVTVTMGILSVLMSIFTASILQVYRTSNATESLSVAETQLHIAMQRLDKQIRYASWVAEPGLVGTSWYVEFADVNAQTHLNECTQLRLDGAGVLQLLRWAPGQYTAGQTVQTLASQLITAGVAQPFQRQVAGSYPYASPSPSAAAVGASYAPDYQRLRVQLTVQAAVTGTTTQLDTTFTALNTSRNTLATNLCSEGRPTS